jgi:hypothetical protein
VYTNGDVADSVMRSRTMKYATNCRRLRGSQGQRRPFRLDEAQIQTSHRRFDGTTDKDKIRWIFKFARPDRLRTSSKRDRIALGYDLRALAQTVGVGWRWRRRYGALAARDLKRIHAAISTGLQRLRASSRIRPENFFDERIGWALPPHRVRLLRMPAPASNPEAKTSTISMFEAANEPSAIVTALGYFLLQHSQHWRICPCERAENFVVKTKERYAPGCANRLRQRKYYNKHLRGKRRRAGHATITETQK